MFLHLEAEHIDFFWVNFWVMGRYPNLWNISNLGIIYFSLVQEWFLTSHMYISQDAMIFIYPSPTIIGEK